MVIIRQKHLAGKYVKWVFLYLCGCRGRAPARPAKWRNVWGACYYWWDACYYWWDACYYGRDAQGRVPYMTIGN